MTIVNDDRDDRILSEGYQADETTLLLKPQTKNSEKKSCLQILKSFKIELFMFIFMFSYILVRICSQNFYMDKVCLNKFKFPANICEHLDNHTDEKEKVEKAATNFNLYKSLIQTIPAVLFSMVIGPWSDKYGRKIPVLLAITGLVLENVGMILNSIYFDAPLYLTLLSSIPAGIFGGFTVTVMCMYSLVSEQTTLKLRTIKYGLLELAMGASVPAGTYLGGVVYENQGYLYVYLLSLILQLIAAMVLLFCVKESINIKNMMTRKVISDLFRFDNFKESFKTVVKQRPNNVRMEICLLIGSICCLMATYTATSDFSYFFTKWMYNWSMATYSNISSIFILIGMFVVIPFVVVLIKVLKLSDSLLGLIGSISMFSSDIIKGVAYETWLYYLGASFGIPGSVGMLAVRTRLSKITPEEELGKIFAFVSSCESLVPVVGGLILTQVFNATVRVFPGTAFIILGLFVILPIFTFSWMYRRKNLKNEATPNSEDQKLLTT